MWISLKIKAFSQMKIVHRVKEEKVPIAKDIINFYYPFYFISSKADDNVKMKKLLFPTLLFAELRFFDISRVINWIVYDPYIYFVYNSKFKYNSDPESYAIKEYEMKKFMKNCDKYMAKKKESGKLAKDDIIKVINPPHIRGCEGRILELSKKEVVVCLFDLGNNNKYRLSKGNVEYVEVE